MNEESAVKEIWFRQGRRGGGGLRGRGYKKRIAGGVGLSLIFNMGMEIFQKKGGLTRKGRRKKYTEVYDPQRNYMHSL